MKIWEVHASLVPVPIQTTPDGAASVAGLLLSEKAYLLVMRAMRPRELVGLVQSLGPEGARSRLLELFAELDLDGTGRGLAPGRTRLGEAILLRNDEVPLAAEAGRWAP
jgi:hypothetical protein